MLELRHTYQQDTLLEFFKSIGDWSQIYMELTWHKVDDGFKHPLKYFLLRCYRFTFSDIKTCSRRAYYFFFGPPYGIIFSENLEKISSH